MTDKREFSPGLSDDATVSMDDVLEHLRRSRSDTIETIELLRASRQQVDENTRLLESPKAVFEYIDFFLKFLGWASVELERVLTELPGGFRPSHAQSLRQLASNGAAEQRRCLMFRDKWINRPLPHEQVRPLLNQISVDSRDQLTAYRTLNNAAERLEKLVGSEPRPPDEGKLDRRALFTRWFER